MGRRFSVEAVFGAVDRMSAPVTRMQNRVGKFTRSVGEKLGRMNRAIAKAGRRLGSAMKVGGLALIAGAAAVGVAVKKIAGDLDQLAKFSRRVDFPIEALQEWIFVAEQSGPGGAVLNASLEKFSKRLGEAKAGFGPLSAGLKKLNPQLLEQLKKTDSISEAFEIYIDALRDVPDATKQASLANAAFGKSGLQLIDISKNSKKAIAALRLEQRENGIATMGQAESAERFNDALNSLTRTGEGLLQKVLIPMLPILTDLSREARSFLQANDAEILGGFNTALARTLKIAKGVAEVFRTIGATGIIQKGQDIGKVIESKAMSAFTGARDFLGLGEGPSALEGQRAHVQAQAQARSAEATQNTAEVTIRDETGRAEVTSGNIGPMLQLTPTGLF